jgi:sulfoxide reductase catalytic subunit YedY
MCEMTDLHVAFATVGFPIWLRVTHYINLLFIGLLIRSGIQILAAHPRLYFNDGCKPGSEWLNFTHKKIPEGKLWTSMDEEVPVTPLIAQPGKDNLGVGRLWHFFVVIFWILNGLIYVVLLFASGEWSRLIPTSWSIIPHAWHTFLTYITFHLPPKSDFQPYDPLQQLAYAGVVFLLAPFMLLTGATMSPAVEAHFPWYIKLFGGRQVGRSLHFLSLLAFIGFIIIHTALVLIVHFQDNIRNIVFGQEQGSVTTAVLIAVAALIVVALVYVWASWYTLRHRRKMQRVLGAVVDRVVYTLLHKSTSVQHFSEQDISPYFWVNGRPPVSSEFRKLADHSFADWRLEVKGLVTTPLCLSLEDIRALPEQKQITRHNCIQGWSGIAEWGGVCVSEVLDLCGVNPEARYVVFTSYQDGKQSYPDTPPDMQEKPFYEVLDMETARHPQTILAYAMNGAPLPLEHGAPLRLRVETELGYKMVKYLHSIELVDDYSTIGKGHGGFREDVQYYGSAAQI